MANDLNQRRRTVPIGSVAEIGDQVGGVVVVAVEFLGERAVLLTDEAGGANGEGLQRVFHAGSRPQRDTFAVDHT